MTTNLSDRKLKLMGREVVEALLTDEHDGVHVSLYMPTRPDQLGHQKDPIRLKNLLQAAEKELGERNLRRAQVDELLAPARELLQDDLFWKSAGHGVAILLQEGEAHVHRLPLQVEEVVVVGDRFHVKPLLPLVQAGDRFWVLALSQHHVRLYEATRYTMRNFDSLDLPDSLEDVVGHDFEDRSLQFHTGAGSNGGARRRAMYHGQGSPGDDTKQEIGEFFRQVDEVVRTLLEGRNEPLVIAAVDYEIALYREVSKYAHVLEEGIEGNPEHVPLEELHREALERVRPLLTEGRRKSAEMFEHLAGTGKASRRLEEILPAAFDGRVATLFVVPSELRWGTYDEDTREIRRDPGRRPDNHDLLELAAARSLLQGADVHAVPAGEIPGDGDGVIAAIFRY